MLQGRNQMGREKDERTGQAVKGSDSLPVRVFIKSVDIFKNVQYLSGICNYCIKSLSVLSEYCCKMIIIVISDYNHASDVPFYVCAMEIESRDYYLFLMSSEGKIMKIIAFRK